jgi:hypothetical protein
MKTTDNLKYTLDMNTETVNIIAKIRLNDECGNGHEDFSLTGSVYEVGKGRSDRSVIVSGACGRRLAKLVPKLQIFADLHLSDADGVPMHAVANGFYWLKENPKFFRSHMRINKEETKQFQNAENKIHFYVLLENSGLLDKWKRQADQAIRQLEDYTGEKFKSTAVRSNLRKPDPATVQKAMARLATGYYSDENLEKRAVEKAKRDKVNLLKELNNDASEEIARIEKGLQVKLYLVENDIPIDNFIYYDHSNEGAFNWRTSRWVKEFSQDEFDAFMKMVDYSKLPAGIKFQSRSRHA